MSNQHRQSPSGPFVASERLRYAGVDPGDNVAAQTGVYGKAEADFAAVPDPATAADREQVAESGFAVLPRGYTFATFSVQRVKGNPAGATPPSGDGDIVVRVQSFNFDDDEQENVGADDDVITFAPDEEGTKTVTVAGKADRSETVFVRASYPTNWVQGDQEPGMFIVLEVVGEV
jgi:hypothetical protein